jgi:hypothetical protein
MVWLALPALAAVPVTSSHQVLGLESIDAVIFPSLNTELLAWEDVEREEMGLPPRFAVPKEVEVSPSTHGTWEDLGQGMKLWRLRIESLGALSLNFGFTRYQMPEGGSLFLYAADESYELSRAFTAEDNENHGELWTPVVLSDNVIIELIVPAAAVDSLALDLGYVNIGYRGFGETMATLQGTCNNDVVCPEGDPWRDEIASVGVISTGGSTFCTGFMVNNTAEDETPYFMTANHCGINSGNASSLVVYWNFESPNCGDLSGGSLSDFQTGSFFRSSYSSSDFTLVELDSAPNPAHNVSFSGWSRSSGDATSAVGIHHPNTDEKAISFEDDPTTTTSYLSNTVPGDGTHVRITDWDDGTTEPGSSGSPLYDQNHHVIGQLHGGYASCTSQTSDWYGRFSVSWTGGGSNSTRLSNWLDPIGSGATTIDTLVPGASGMRVTPASGLDSEGQSGGPFSPSSIVYTVENNGVSSINYTVTKSASWVTLSTGGGSIPAGGSTTVTVSINSGANALPDGGYSDTVTFTNTTDHDGDTTRAVNLQVGVPVLIYSYDMSSNPGWTTAGQWAWGTPTGGGGQYGNPDPTSGHSGPNVYGYNLAGDYANSLAETHLTSTAIDCSALTDVSVKFWRYLNVEQPSYDHAYVRVSNNGSSWTTVWENSSEITDSSWSQVEYDISAVADGQSTVYLRWTMGATDSSWQFSGWNIDDVEIWGMGGTVTPTDTVAAGFSCTPGSGVVPFTTSMWASLDNLYTGQLRRVAARINVVTGGGGSFNNWRSGFTNIAAGGNYTTSWNQSIPALGALLGTNTFTLQAQDVTPSPYNQPPYPPAGDTDSAACTVEAIAP